jgi:hypothetical protein
MPLLYIPVIIFLIVLIIVLAVVLSLPQTVSCMTDDKAYFVALYGAPTITSVNQTFFCQTQPVQTFSVQFTGENFARINVGEDDEFDTGFLINGENLTGTFSDCTEEGEVPSWGTEDSKVPKVRGQVFQLCGVYDTEFTLTLGTTPTTPNVTVNPFEGPHPHPIADMTRPQICGGEDPGAIIVQLPPPRVLASVPNSICKLSTDTELTSKFPPGGWVLTGTMFACITNSTDGTVACPSLRLDSTIDTTFTHTFAVQSSWLSDCTTLETIDATLSYCTTLTIPLANIPELISWPLGTNTLTIDHPSQATCGAAVSTFPWDITGPPTLTQQPAPAAICPERAVNITFFGTYLRPSTTIELQNQASPSLVRSANQIISANGTVLVANFYASPDDLNSYFVSGLWNVIATNGQCIGGGQTIRVFPIVLTYFVAPPVFYNGITLSAVVYVSGLDRDAASVHICPGIYSEVNSSCTLLAHTPRNPPKYSQLDVTVPAGLPAGTYTVITTSQDGCSGFLSAGLRIVDQTNLALDSIDPAYVEAGNDAGVRISGGPFGSVPPLVFINPVNPTASDKGLPLKAVLGNAAGDQLTAVIPGTSARDYDVIVVTYSGQVGRLPNSVHVISDAPPYISSAAPSSIVSATRIDFFGANFMAPINLTAICDAAGCVHCTAAVDIGNAALTSVGLVDSTHIYGTFDPALIPLQTSQYCKILLENGNGATFLFSSVSQKSSSGNLAVSWTAVTPLNTARAHNGLILGRPTPSSSFFYVLGGDNGNPTTGGLRSVENSEVDLNGVFGPWAEVTQGQLPRNLSGVKPARVGQFLYVVGGLADGAPTAEVWRSFILDPLDVLDLDPSLDIGDPQSTDRLVNGTWFYIVSAVYPLSYDINPGGEGLPGQLLTLTLPKLPNVTITLTWDALPAASEYILYRTPGPDMLPSAAEMIYRGSNTSFRDVGVPSLTPRKSPLKVGALGNWFQEASLSVPREGHSVVFADVPQLNSTTLIAVFGGRNGTGATTMVEYALVQRAAIGNPSAQGTLTWVSGTDLPGAHTDGASVIYTTSSGVAYDPLAAQSGGSAQPVGDMRFFVASVIFSPTSTQFGTASISRTGQMGSWQECLNKLFHGHCQWQANQFLYTFAGTASNSASGTSGTVSPTLWPASSYSADPAALPATRSYPGCAHEIVFFLVAGGCAEGGSATPATGTTTCTPTNTVWRNVQ